MARAGGQRRDQILHIKGIFRATSIGLDQTQDQERSETANAGGSITHASEMGATWQVGGGARTVRISRTSAGLDTNRAIKMMNI